MSDNIRVLIVDDQPRARQSLKALLATWPEAKEVKEAALGREAIRLIQASQPDVVLMDVQMPEMDGLEVTRFIKARWPQVKVIVLTMYAEYAADAQAAGADAFVCKGEPPEKLLITLAAVAAGRRPEMAQHRGVRC
jgi:DNA-binding NarL/FixJ family response regulator